MRGGRVLSSVACALFLFSAPLFAETNAAGTMPSGGATTAPDKVPPIARTRYDEGIQAYKAGRYKDAVDLFIEADRLAPSAALSFNVARAYGKIGDTENSLAWYRDYLRRAPDAKDRAEVEATIAKLAAKLAQKGVQQVTVLSDPQGATVLVDGRPVGVTTWTGQLPPGKHKISLRLQGYQDWDELLDLPSDKPQDVSIPLIEAPAKPVAAEPQQPAAQAVVSPSAPRKDVVRESGGVHPLTWVVLGGGVASLGAAGVFELLRRNAADDAESEQTQIGRADKLDEANARMNTARVLAGVGGALVVIGGVLLVVDLSSDGASETKTGSLAVGCAPAFCGATGRANF